MALYHQGRFKPEFPEKYIGDVDNIIYRSSWELKVFIYCDRNTGVKRWASEELVIPYVSPIDGKRHRYFTDVYLEKTNGDKVVLEIKPHAQTVPPVKKSRVTKRYLREVQTWGINQAKWEAAHKYCKRRGWKFQVVTEKNLFKKRD